MSKIEKENIRDLTMFIIALALHMLLCVGLSMLFNIEVYLVILGASVALSFVFLIFLFLLFKKS